MAKTNQPPTVPYTAQRASFLPRRTCSARIRGDWEGRHGNGGRGRGLADLGDHNEGVLDMVTADVVFARKYLQDMQRSHGDKFLHKTLLMKIEFAVARASGEAIPL